MYGFGATYFSSLVSDEVSLLVLVFHSKQKIVLAVPVFLLGAHFEC